MRCRPLLWALASLALSGCTNKNSSSAERGPDVPPSSPRADPHDQSLLGSVIAIDSGGDSTCALLDSGQVACWGSVAECTGPNWLCKPAPRPVLLPGDVKLTDISGGGGYWWGLDGSGSLYTWGTSIEPLGVRQLLSDPSRSALEADPDFVAPSAVASEESNWILRDSEGLHSIRPLRFGIKGIKRFANGCVRDRSDNEFCLHQGRQESGWVGPVPPKFADSYASAGIRISVCRTDAREMRCEYFPTRDGFDGEAEAEAIAQLPSDSLSLHVGPFTMCAVLGSGKVGCAPVWDLRKGAFGTGTVRFQAEIREPGKVTSLTIAEHDICAIVDGGRVKCWWPPEPFQRHPSPSSDDARRDVRGVEGVKDVVALAGGAQHMCAVISDGTVQCWGMDDLGQLGDGAPFESSKVPVRVLAPVPARGAE